VCGEVLALHYTNYDINTLEMCPEEEEEENI